MNRVEELLLEGTGETADWWMNFIGERVVAHTDDKRSTDSGAWLKDVADALWGRVKPRYDLTVMDENIICSSLASLIYTLWSCRIRRAKSYDPRRPLEVRKGMMGRLLGYQHALLDYMTDESRDHVYFPAQEWGPPFAPNAKEGGFV